MLKRVAILGAIAALTIWNPPNCVAQGWGGVTVTVAGFPGPYPYRARPYYARPAWCCRPYYPRPVWCCNRPYAYPYAYSNPYPYYGRPPYYYGDSFAPYAYNWNRYDAGYNYNGYGAGYNEAGYGYGSDGY